MALASRIASGAVDILGPLQELAVASLGALGSLLIIFFMLTIVVVIYLTMGSSQAMKAAWMARIDRSSGGRPESDIGIAPIDAILGIDAAVNRATLDGSHAVRRGNACFHLASAEEMAQGFRAVKLRLGHERDLHHEEERVQTVREG